MKKTFTIKLDTEITIDFTHWGLSDAEQRGGDESRKLVIEKFLDECGMDEFDIVEKDGNTLFEAMAQVIQAQNDYFLAHIDEFEHN